MVEKLLQKNVKDSAVTIRKENEGTPRSRLRINCMKKGKKVIYDFLAVITPKKDGSRKSSLVFLGRANERQGEWERQEHT